jgi:uncharacterized membrane protein
VTAPAGDWVEPALHQRAASRLLLLDAARGVAILMMVAYHLAWDLTAYRLVEVPLYDSFFWLAFRSFIPTCFLIIVGLSLVPAYAKGVQATKLAKRLVLVGGGAALVSLATWFSYPQTWIFFGVLHSIAVASVLALPLIRAPYWILWLLGLGVLAAPYFLAYPVFDVPWLWWLGLVEVWPPTNDYVPIFPWFSAVIAGLALGRLWFANGPPPWLAWRAPGSAGAVLDFLAWGGRHALAIYLLHQPILLGLVWMLYVALTGESGGGFLGR